MRQACLEYEEFRVNSVSPCAVELLDNMDFAIAGRVVVAGHDDKGCSTYGVSPCIGVWRRSCDITIGHLGRVARSSVLTVLSRIVRVCKACHIDQDEGAESSQEIATEQFSPDLVLHQPVHSTTSPVQHYHGSKQSDVIYWIKEWFGAVLKFLWSSFGGWFYWLMESSRTSRVSCSGRRVSRALRWTS